MGKASFAGPCRELVHIQRGLSNTPSAELDLIGLHTARASCKPPPLCGRFDTSHLTWQQIHSALQQFLDVTTPALNDIVQNDDVRPTTQQIIARVGENGWVVERMRWGLVPHWRSGKPLKDTAKGAGDGFKLTTFNARCEGVALAATYKAAFAARRCVVPATSWYEWTGAPGSKVRHTFRRRDGEALWFAGIWDRAVTSDAGEILSFSILTGQSSGHLQTYHDRAPLILEPSELARWAGPAFDRDWLPAADRADRFEVSE